MEKNQETTYYRTVPVSERLPKKGTTDYYHVITTSGWLRCNYFNGQVFEDQRVNPDIKEWLEPISIPDAERLRDALEKIVTLSTSSIGTKGKYIEALQEIAREALSSVGDGWVRVEDGLPEDWSKDVWAMSKSKGEVEEMSAGNLVKYKQYYSHWHPQIIPSPPINK